MHELLLDPEFRTQRFRALRDTFPTHMNQIEAEQAMYCLWHREHRRQQRVGRLMRLWPVAAGLLLALFAPALYAFLTRSHPWGMWLVFPFALLAHRPELEVNDRIASVLPQVILYAQFPIEGLVARMALRRHVTLPGVTGQIFYFHFLAAVQLAMVSGLLNPLFVR
jgi:hypothetical protein